MSAIILTLYAVPYSAECSDHTVGEVDDLIGGIVSYKLSQAGAGSIEEWLGGRRGGKVEVIVPKKGQKERLMELAHKNAALVLTQDSEKIKREELRTAGAMAQICGWIGLHGISRIESYDISNINGFQSVGSMVVFENGKLKEIGKQEIIL